MSLKRYQDEWMNIMFSRDLETAKKVALIEKSMFKGLSLSRLKTISSTVEAGKISVLCAVLPASLKRHLSESEQHELAQKYVYECPEATVSPGYHAVPLWLEWLAQQEVIKSVLCLVDLINYEKACLKLCYYQLPKLPVLKYEKLAPWATLFTAHADFPEILKSGAAVDFPVHDGNRQGWLVYQYQNTYHYQRLHWAIYEIIKKLDGSRSYDDYAETFCASYSDLAFQQEMSFSWYSWLKQTNLLTFY